MHIVGKVLVSEDILERKFACQLSACKGACCIQGDAGAPLEEGEIEIIAKELSSIEPFMSEHGRSLLKEKGFHEVDAEGETGTICADDGACVFVNYENSVAVCSIERAYEAGRTWFQKPLSCHLYPIRAKRYGEYVALNYHNWEICSPACKAGTDGNIAVHRFLKDALVRKLGPAWYRELDAVSEAWWKEKQLKGK